ncbi:MAG: NAD(P)H-binding protein [Gemmatimonadaceae bacterium]|nr:NAD(P)H-binding protein [Gemmatimonadaceae bacterium]
MTASRRVFLLGATGTIGRATLRALLDRGHDVTCFVRHAGDGEARAAALRGATVRTGDVTDPASLRRDGFRGEHFDAVVSCMASRTGAPKDAWAIDHRAHAHALTAAKAADVTQFVLLSAICVQKPMLAFQHAKLAFETELMASGLKYSIVRATAYFKSLSGQLERVRRGKPYLMFGDGRLTSCKPISDADLAAYLADCIDDTTRHDRILPIGGPGPAITPLEQGETLFALTGRAPKYTRVPVAMLDVIIGVLSALGRVIPPLADKAEFARIGRYYATESMLVLNPVTGHYDADATPETGSDTLAAYCEALVRTGAGVDRGDHAVF